MKHILHNLRWSRCVMLVALAGCNLQAGVVQSTKGSAASTTQAAMTPNGTLPTAPLAASDPNTPAAQATSPNTVMSPNSVAPGTGPAVQANFVFSPYKDVTISANWNTGEISTAVTGTLTPLLVAAPNVSAVTWAFATGECGAETWGGLLAADLVKANLANWVAAKKGYIISTGGAAGSFTCGTDAGFATFIDRYASAYLLGIDFDIEAGQSAADIAALVARVKGAKSQTKYKNLRFSFTLATLAGSTPQSLGAQGVVVMEALKSAGVTDAIINLMTMDYGSATATNCTLDAAGACAMGLSAIQAAKNLNVTYQIPYSHIEITPMIGGNDTPNETFTLEDISILSTFVRANGLGGVHHWSLDRDKDCSQTTASPICNSYGRGGVLGFSKGFQTALGL